MVFSKQSKGKKVFISYRRQDAAATAGRINDTIKQLMPNAQIFMDVEAIAGGDLFSDKIFSAIKECDIFICLMGDKWAINTDGENRLQNIDDYVRMEVETALQADCTVYPILLNDCKMPTLDILPEALQPLSAFNALELRNTRFNDDILHILETVFGVKREKLQSNRVSRALRALVYGLPAGLFILFILAQLNNWLTNESLDTLLGEGITIGLIILIPLLSISVIYRKTK